MATATVNLKVLLESVGIKASTKKLKELAAQLEATEMGMNKVANAANKVKRNQDGAAERTGNATKDFARMSQGLGGLVQAYATVAANVFALSSAFLVLRRAADLSSMQKSAQNFSDKFGVNVDEITKKMQQASGGAISFAEALPIINKAVSAGIPTDKLTELTQAATKAAQTFGGTATEALNRFISASQRGRVEIIQTLGIVINTDQAYNEYAATIGKTRTQLTAFDKQQAILNATIAESKNIFEAVVIDPNPFQQLLTTIVDLKNEVSVFITDALTPMFNAFNKSKAAAAALIALIVSSVSGRIFPAVSDLVARSQEKAAQASEQALARVKSAEKAKAEAELSARKKLNATLKINLVERTQLFESTFKKELAQLKAYGRSLVTENGKINQTILQQRIDAIQKEVALRAQGRQGELAGIGTQILRNESARLQQIQRELGLVGRAQEKVAFGLREIKVRAEGTFGRISARLKGMRASISLTTAQMKLGFSEAFAAVQTAGVSSLSVLTQKLRELGATAGAATGLSFAQRMGAAIGAAGGTIAAGLTKVFGAFLQITLLISAGLFIFEKFGDQLRGISEAERIVIDASKDLTKALDEVSERTDRVLTKLERAPRSLNDLREAFTFTAGTFRSINEALTDFDVSVTKALQQRTIAEYIDQLEDAEKQLDEFNKEVRSAPPLVIGGTNVLTKEVDSQRRALEQQVEVLQSAIKSGIPALSKAIAQSNRAAIAAGFVDTAAFIEAEFANLEEINFFEKFIISTAVQKGNIEEIITALQSASNVAEGFGIRAGTQVDVLIDKLRKFVSFYVSGISEISTTNATSIKQLQELNKNVGIYTSGLNRLRNANVANKEILDFLITARQEFAQLAENQERLTSVKLSELIDDKGLSNVFSLLQIDPTQDLSQILSQVEKNLNVFRRQQEQQLITDGQLAVINANIAIAKEQQARSQDEQLEKAKRLNFLETQKLQTERNLLIARIEAQKTSLAGLREQSNISNSVIRQAEIELKSEQEQLRVISAQIKLKSRELELEQEIIDLREKSFDTVDKGIRTLQQIANIQLSLSSGLREEVEIRQLSISLQQAALDARADAIQRQLSDSEKLKNLQEEDLVNLGIELRLIEQQNRQLERRRLIGQARDLQNRGIGDDVLTKEGVELLGGLFANELRKGILDLEPNLEILAKGFAKTLNTTIDAGIDKLLEGGGFSNFASTLIDTIKEGLRTTIGDVLKSRIKESLGNFLAEQFNLESEASVEKDSIAASKNLKIALDELRKVIEKRAQTREANRGFDPAESDRQLPGVAGIAKDQVEQKVIPAEAATQTTLVESNNTLVTALNQLRDTILNFFNKKPEDSNIISQVEGTASDKTAQVAGEGLSTVGGNVKKVEKGVDQVVGTNTEGFANVQNAVKQLGGLLGQSQTSSFVSGLVNAAVGFFATGGAATPAPTGGGSSVPGLATGGIVRKPSLIMAGEGKNSEAVVPLPNNREIPVKLEGGGKQEIRIEQNFDFRNADVTSIAQLRAQAKLIEDKTFNRVFSEINKGGKYSKMVGRR